MRFISLSINCADCGNSNLPHLPDLDSPKYHIDHSQWHSHVPSDPGAPAMCINGLRHAAFENSLVLYSFYLAGSTAADSLIFLAYQCVAHLNSGGILFAHFPHTMKLINQVVP